MNMMLTNANVFTADDAQPTADTIVVENGKISYVGTAAGAGERGGLPVHDLGGRTVLPGFVDSHAHPTMVSQSFWHVRLPWTTDVEEILAFIEDYAQKHPKDEAPYLYFEYYPSETFKDFPPTKEMLDRVVSDRPVLCQDFSEHEHWVNSKMLELMGITSETPDPVPGLETFVRDENGEPTGQLRELVHMNFIDTMFEKLDWTPPEELTPENAGRFFRFMSENGVTALFEALVEDDEIIKAVVELDRRGELNMLYHGALKFRNSTDLPEVIATIKRYDAEYGSEHVRINTLKLFLDGTNEIGNSAVIEPKCSHGSSDNHGEIAMEMQELADCFATANEAGVDVHIHLVGDRAFRVACDAVEEVQRRLAAAGIEWRSQVTLAHCELVDPADMHRPAELGIIINWTPHWSGGYFGEGAKKYLGEERWNRMYKFTEMVASGATVAYSSDVVTSYELNRGKPFFGIQVANTRVDPECPLDPERFPDSVRPGASDRIPLDVLLKGHTLHGARQMRIQDTQGSIEVGKLANLSIVDADPFSTDPARLKDLAMDAVIFEGRVVVGSL